MAWQVVVKFKLWLDWTPVGPDRLWVEPPIRFWTEEQAQNFADKQLSGHAAKRVVKVDDGPGDKWVEGVSW